jgi:hypothetical protein
VQAYSEVARRILARGEEQSTMQPLVILRNSAVNEVRTSLLFLTFLGRFLLTILKIENFTKFIGIVTIAMEERAQAPGEIAGECENSSEAAE